MGSLRPRTAPGCYLCVSSSVHPRLPSPLKRPDQRQPRPKPFPNFSVPTVASSCFSNAPCRPPSVVPHEHAPLPTLAFPSPSPARSPPQPARARLRLVFRSPALLCPTDFHVQLSYRSRTSAWESCFSNIDHALNSKSYSSAFLRSA